LVDVHHTIKYEPDYHKINPALSFRGQKRRSLFTILILHCLPAGEFSDNTDGCGGGGGGGSGGDFGGAGGSGGATTSENGINSAEGGPAEVDKLNVLRPSEQVVAAELPF
jgi:hypothetical protein